MSRTSTPVWEVGEPTEPILVQNAALVTQAERPRDSLDIELLTTMREFEAIASAIAQDPRLFGLELPLCLTVEDMRRMQQRVAKRASRNRRRIPCTVVAFESLPVAQPPAISDDEKQTIHDAINCLPSNIRIYIEQHYFAPHKPIAVIAAEQGCSERTGYNRRDAGYAMLRVWLADCNYIDLPDSPSFLPLS